MKSPNIRNLFFTLAIFCAAMISVPNAQAQFENDAKWIPESANCVVMVQARRLLDSELGKKENWRKDRHQAFRSGASFIPTSVDRFMMASQIDYEFLESVFHVGVFVNKGPAINMVEVSKKIPGNLETIAGKNAIVLPNNSYLVRVEDSVLVSMTPSNRQMTTRLIRKKATGKMNVSPYLAQAVKFADNNADIIVAFDLDGVMNKDEVIEHLKREAAIDESVVEVYADTISGLQGMTLGVTVRDKISGSIKLDFNGSAAGLAKVGPKIMQAALENNGLMIDDFKNWSMTVNGNQIRFSGPMTSEGLGQVGHLIHQPINNDIVGMGGEGSSSTDVPESDMKTRTKQYFGDVNHVLEMIRRKDLEQLNTYSKWFSRYARDIDGISTIGVDPAMVAYGTYVADAFRDISGGLDASYLDRNKSVQAQGFSGPGSNTFTYGYGYGTIYGRNVTRNRRRAAGQIKTDEGANKAKDVMREIDSETANIRRAMTEKYQIEF